MGAALGSHKPKGPRGGGARYETAGLRRETSTGPPAAVPARDAGRGTPEPPHPRVDAELRTGGGCVRSRVGGVSPQRNWARITPLPRKVAYSSQSTAPQSAAATTIRVTSIATRPVRDPAG